MASLAAPVSARPRMIDAKAGVINRGLFQGFPRISKPASFPNMVKAKGW